MSTQMLELSLEITNFLTYCAFQCDLHTSGQDRQRRAVVPDPLCSQRHP